jgi:sugar lactone lactonase YvrE
LKPPAGITPVGPVGAFSPDEQRLAAGVTVGGRDRLAVVDLRTGHWMLVAGGKLGGYRAIAWSPSGAWLYFTASNRRLLGWRFGAERAVPLPIVPGGTVMSIATAEPGR